MRWDRGAQRKKIWILADSGERKRAAVRTAVSGGIFYGRIPRIRRFVPAGSMVLSIQLCNAAESSRILEKTRDAAVSVRFSGAGGVSDVSANGLFVYVF